MEFKAKAKPREQILALIVLVGIGVLFFRVVYFPKRIASVQGATKLQNLQLEQQALEKFTQALLKQLPLMKKETTPSPQLRILKGEMAPYAEATALLLAQWSSPQFLRGVDIKKMSDLPPQKVEGYWKSNFAVQVIGTFRQVFSFLEQIEKFPALVTVDNITLKAINTKASRVDLELSGTLYHLGEGK